MRIIRQCLDTFTPSIICLNFNSIWHLCQFTVTLAGWSWTGWFGLHPAGLEAALDLLLPVGGLLLVLCAEAVVPLRALQVEEAPVIRLLRGAGNRATLAHAAHLQIWIIHNVLGLYRTMIWQDAGYPVSVRITGKIRIFFAGQNLGNEKFQEKKKLNLVDIRYPANQISWNWNWTFCRIPTRPDIRYSLNVFAFKLE